VTRLRVMHVINAMDRGGAEMVVLEHVRHAAPEIETHVCAVNVGGWALEEAERLGARALVLGKESGRFAAFRRLADALRRGRVDVVNGHNPTGALYATIAARLAGVPVIVRTEHSFHYPGRHSALYAWLLEPPLTAVANRVVCVSETVHQSHAHRIPWMAGRFVTIANGISAPPAVRPRGVARADLGLGADDPVALTAGGLTRPKAQHVLVNAFAQVVAALPAARLLLAGEGPMRPALEQLIREHHLEANVRLLGSREDVPELLEAADVFVLSSVREGLSMTLLEAMRAGRAAVATGVGGNGEAIAVGKTGLLVPPQDPKALAEAVTALLADREKAQAWGAAARERWARLFTAERMTRDTERIYWEERGLAAPSGVTQGWEEGRREAVR